MSCFRDPRRESRRSRNSICSFDLSAGGAAAAYRAVARTRHIGVWLTLHSTMEVVRPDVKVIRLTDIRQTLANVCRLLVHSVDDLNRLKVRGLIDNVALFPQGVPEPFNGDRAAVRRSLGLESKAIIASFGFLLPHSDCVSLLGPSRCCGRRC